MCLHYIHKHPQSAILTACHICNNTSKYLGSKVLESRTAVNDELKNLCK
jgi:hypothetical protein